MEHDDATKADASPAATARDESPAAPHRLLSPAAERALREAEERRKAYRAREEALPKELGGRRKGNEPARYGDWEKQGLAVDF